MQCLYALTENYTELHHPQGGKCHQSDVIALMLFSPSLNGVRIATSPPPLSSKPKQTFW